MDLFAPRLPIATLQRRKIACRADALKVITTLQLILPRSSRRPMFRKIADGDFFAGCNGARGVDIEEAAEIVEIALGIWGARMVYACDAFEDSLPDLGFRTEIECIVPEYADEFLVLAEGARCWEGPIELTADVGYGLLQGVPDGVRPSYEG